MTRRVLSVAIAFGLACSAVSAEPRQKPDILVIVVDTLRADHVGCYGYARETTPAIDALARDGVLFRSAVAASSWTLPSVMSLFTSLDPSLHGLTTNHRKAFSGPATLAGVLQTNGYQTAGIVSTPALIRKYGFGRGFDDYDDISILLNVDFDMAGKEKAGEGAGLKTTSESVTRQAVNWLRNKRTVGKPFMLFLFYFDPHLDYEPPAGYDTMFTDPEYSGSQKGAGILSLVGKSLTPEDKKQIIGLYDGEIRYTDDQIGRLLDECRELGLYDDMLILLTGDHGEEFWDHGGLGHGHTLYEELVRVPAILKLPAGASAGVVCSNLVSNIDFMPTLLSLTDAPIPSQCQGAILAMDGSDVASETRMETEVYESLKGIRTPTLKLIQHLPGQMLEAYRLTDDSFERKNLAAKGGAPDDFKNVLERFKKWMKILESAPRESGSAVTIEPELLEKLRTLGYVK